MPRNYSNHSPRRREQCERPHLFGRGLRDHVLLCLAVNGPMHLKLLAKALEAPPPAVFRAVSDLLRIGVLVKGGMRGYRNRPIALNRRLSIYPALRRLLLAVDRHWPSPRVSKKRWRASDLPAKSNMSQQLSRPIFQSATRERVLVYLALAGKADYVTMAEALSVDWMSVKAAVKRWEKEGVVRSDSISGTQRAALDPYFTAAKELRVVLNKLSAG